MLKGYINLLHKNLALELEKYRNIPFYLAIPYLRSKDKAYLNFRENDILTYVRGQKEEYYSIVNPNTLEPYGPFTFVDNYYARPNSIFKVYESQFTIGPENRKPGYLKKYVYARNNNLRRIIGSLVHNYNKTEGGIPNYLVFAYLNFYRNNQVYATNEQYPGNEYEALLRFDKQNKLLKIKENLEEGKKYAVLQDAWLVSMFDDNSRWGHYKFKLIDEELSKRIGYNAHPYIRYTDAEDGTIIRTTISGGQAYPKT